jgi:F0F1-type ATP synthase delta subunit
LKVRLNDEQLDQLESILAKDLDRQSEFSMLLEGKMVANLNDEQLDQLGNILAKDLDSQSRFSMLHDTGSG